MEEEKRNFVINYRNQPTFFVCVEFRGFPSSDFMERSCDLVPQKYSSVHIDELHGTIPLWMAPKTMEDFHEPEENRKWVFYNLDVSIWQCNNGERRYVVRILERPDHHGEQPSPADVKFPPMKGEDAMVDDYFEQDKDAAGT